VFSIDLRQSTDSTTPHCNRRARIIAGFSAPIRRFRHLLARKSEGQSALEAALVLPILLTVLTGIATFGVAMNNYLVLTEATSVGARQLAISRGAGGDPCSVAAAAIAAAAPLLSNSGATTGIGYSFTIYTTTSTSTTFNSSPPTCSGATLVQGQQVTVSTTYPCSLKIFRVNYVPSCFLKAQTSEVTQ